MRHSNPRFAVLVFFVALMALRCGGGAPRIPSGDAAGAVSGLVVKGPVQNGAVTAYKLDDQMVRGASLGSATTDESGAFTIPLPSYNGALMVVASTGSYVEEAIGLSVKLDGHELAAVVPAYKAGATLADLRVTPISTLSAAAAAFHVQKKGTDLATANAEASIHLNSHFGDVDWRVVTPADLTVPGVSNLSPEAKAGLVLSALSFQARTISTDNGVTPGLTVNAATLTAALASDLGDGTFDGIGPAGTLTQSKTALDGNTARRGLSQAVSAFIQSDRNASALTLVDVKTFLTAIASNSDPYLFCPNQQAGAGCAGTGVDVEPPVVTFVKPTNGAGVNGQVAVQVRAEDASKVTQFKFTEPAQLAAVLPTFESGGKVAVLNGTLDVSAVPDGLLTIAVSALDDSGNGSGGSIKVTVSNNGPRVSISAPGDGATVKGAAIITATATAQNGTIAKLELVSPPPGVGADQLPAADAFAAAWNTSQAPEGFVTLTFRATDTLGTSTDASVSVVVDNIALGTVTVALSAGAPVAGATVKLVAIDDATGLPVVGRTGGATLGSGGPTLADGTLTFTLAQENWTGPVQLVASGPSLTFIDPSDGVTQISIPATFEFTSMLASYKTGDALSAPITLWTTIADAAARAYAQGKNPISTTPKLLSAALAVTDPLFSAHLSRPTAWNIRTTAPVSLTQPPTQSLRDAVYAAMPDVALSNMARSISLEASVTPGQVVTAVTLAAQLVQDVGADGLLDGKAGTAQLQTAGSPPYSLDAATTRFKLATELDKFIRDPLNKTGLLRADLQNANVYNNVCLDQSLLYPSSQPPMPFDETPPTVTFSVTFGAADGTTMAAVGLSNLVAGVVTVTVDATDLSGVKALTVTVGGVPLTPAVGTNTATHFVGTWATTVAGPLVFTATATDKLLNSGPTLYQALVDNTQPTVAIASPVASFLSAAVAVDATATDANGISSTVTDLAGFVDTDATAARVLGSWPLPVVRADGPLVVTVTGCDLVHNCKSGTATVTVDRTPPTLAVVTAPPAFTKAASVGFTVSAADSGAGVKQVYAQVNGVGTVYSGVLGAGTWTFTGVGLAGPAGTNTVKIWADDLAAPANSGAGKGAPNEMTFTVLKDTTLPVVALEAFGSYYDERNMDFVRVAATGRAALPAQYTYTGAKVQLAPTTPIYKAATRLSWGATAPTAAELESTNASNTPFLQYSVLFDPATDAPMGAVVFAVTAIDGVATGAGLQPAWPSPRVVAGKVFFDVPLNGNTVPALLTRGGATATLTVILGFQDQAGNTTPVGPLAVPYNVVGPPLDWDEDATAYPAANDPWSIYPYRTANNTYSPYFDPANPTLGTIGQARVVRYVVRNPATVPVAIAATVTGSSTRTESWKNHDGMTNISQAFTWTRGGFTFQERYDWNSVPGSEGSCGVTAYPCGWGQLDNFLPLHTRNSGTGAQFDCAPPSSLLNIGGTVTPYSVGATLGARAYANPAPAGAETTAPTAYLRNGRAWWVVPAATATAPGQIVVYVLQSVSTRIQDGMPPLAWGTTGVSTGVAGYESWVTDYWPRGGLIFPYCGTAPQPYYHLGYTITERLQTAQLAVAGQLLGDSVGLYGTALLGAPLQRMAPTFSKSFNP